MQKVKIHCSRCGINIFRILICPIPISLKVFKHHKKKCPLMAALESAQWLDLASQPPKGFNVLHLLRIPVLNFYKDKKLIAVNSCLDSNFFAIQCRTCRSFHARLKCLDISVGHSALFDSGHLRLRFKASGCSCYPAIVALSTT